MPTIELPYNWNPRPYQLPLWNYLERGGKRAVAVWNRRAGKDEVCLHWTAVAAMQKPATYWHMLPEAAQARKAIWDAINPHTGKRRIDEAFPQEIRANTNNQEMFIRFKNGATWQVVGSDNYDSLVGSPPAGVVFSEWPLSKADAWAYLRPILAENGGWALFVYTPRGENHGKATYDMAVTDPDWFGQLLTVDDTRVLTPAQIEKERLEYIAQYGRTRGEALFQQEWYCSFKPAFTGKVIYPDFDRRLHVATESLIPIAQEGAKAGRAIVRGWDNTGLCPACVVTYLNTLGQWFIVKEFCVSDADIVEFATEVDLWCKQMFPFAEYQGSRVPFTNYVDYGDPAGRIRDTRKKSPAQYIQDEVGINIVDGVQTFKVRVGSVTRRLMKMTRGGPGLVVDPDCTMIIDGFAGGYCYPEIGNTGVYKPYPDKNNPYTHPADALQYAATRLFSDYDEPTYSYEGYVGDQGKNKTAGY